MEETQRIYLQKEEEISIIDENVPYHTAVRQCKEHNRNKPLYQGHLFREPMSCIPTPWGKET